MQRLSYFLRIPHVSHAGGLLVSAAWFAAQTEFGNRNKNARLRGHSYFLAETEGFAYVPQAAESLASDSLRIPHVSHAGGLLVSAVWFAAQTEFGNRNKNARLRGHSYFLAETEGFEPSIQV